MAAEPSVQYTLLHMKGLGLDGYIICKSDTGSAKSNNHCNMAQSLAKSPEWTEKL